MKYNKLTLFLITAVFMLLLTAGAVVLAQSSANFGLSWHVIGNGGGESSSASYQVNGTIGQSVSSQPKSDSANFVVSSGYWHGNTRTTIYLPAILKN